MKLALRLYRCTNCSRESMHTTNHTMSIYPICPETEDQQRHEYLEDVKVVTLDISRPLREQVSANDFFKITHAIGRMVAVDSGRRIYITSRGAQAESLDKMRKRIAGV